ncbi:hypothetical protein MBLNU230_g6245t1 [Neophaeotheca triangularis]
MRHFWALPAVLRLSLVLASQHSFSVNDDLLAFPQYAVAFSDDYLTEAQAQSRLASNKVSLDNHHTPSHIEHYKPRPDDSHSPDHDSSKDDTKYNHEQLILQGNRYLCSIPQVTKAAQEARQNDSVTQAEERKELARANNRGWELLHSMQDNCMYFIGGWWSYKFCYNQGVKQFHQLPPSRGVPIWPPVEDPTVEGYTLGTYTPTKEGGEPKTDGASAMPEEFDKWEGESALEVSEHAKKMRTNAANGELVVRGDTRYLVQNLDQGTMCDLTGKPRRIEVQYHCHPSAHDRISLIKETSTCAYLMVVQTPRLCNDVAFLPPAADQPNEITCSPILTPDQIPSYEHDLASLHEEEKAAALEQSRLEAEAAEALLTGEQPTALEPGPQIAGDIVIGGHNLVPPGKLVEKSALLGGGKETYVDTLVDSTGKMLSRAKMDEYGLDSEKAVKKLAARVEEAAMGAAWRLDIVDTARGREYRGIIDKDDEGGKGEKVTAEQRYEEKPGGNGGGAGEGGQAAAGAGDGGVDGADIQQQQQQEEQGEGSEEEFFYKEEL